MKRTALDVNSGQAQARIDVRTDGARMSRLVVVGSVNVDLVARVPVLPGPGETVLGPGIERHGGGKGANAATAAARLGADVALVGATGDDDLGAGVRRELEDEAVDIGDVAVLRGVATGAALIVVDDHAENQIAVGTGANGALTAAVVERALARRLDGCGGVLVSTEIPDAAVAAAVRGARAAGVPCILNPAPARPELLELLDAGPLLTPNRGELAVLAGGGAPEAAAAALATRTGAPVVVTLGADGVLAAEPDGATWRVAAHPAEPVDTTGAGDTFNGALAAQLAAGEPLRAAVAYSVVAAALSVEHPGARGGMPDAAAVAAAGRI